MPDTMISRHPLTDSTVHGIEMPGANHLELVEAAKIYTVQAFRGRNGEVKDQLAATPGIALRFVGPGDWVAVSMDAAPKVDPAAALVVDQSHGRTLFRLKGPDAIDILMKGVSVDIAGEGLPVGTSANMAFGHLTINLARTGETEFEIVGARSFAESLYHDLKQAGREFAMSFAVVEQ
jgi:heterotetrameric sarcosine oxidase gamma subunit